MKKQVVFTVALVLMGLFTSCVEDIHIPSDKQLPLGLYEENESTGITGNYKKTLDGVETTESLITSRRITTLEILPDNKIVFGEREEEYYSHVYDDYTTLPEPKVTYSYESTGSYKVYLGNEVVFDLDDEDNGGPLQDGCYWDYELNGKKLKIKKQMRIHIDGTIIYEFERVDEE